MKNNNLNQIKKIKRTALILAFILFIAYGAWNGRDIALGPKVDIFYPANGESLSSKLIKINGQALNAAYLSLNDRQIFVDDAGYFSEYVALLPGYNIVKISSKDRFGETREKLLHLYFKE